MSYSNPLDSYGTLRDELAKQYSEDSVDSDPSLAAEALMKLVASNNPPLRLILGSMVYDLAMDTLKARMATGKNGKLLAVHQKRLFLHRRDMEYKALLQNREA
nr:hypothetical protein BNIPNGOD_00028 [Salmonella enterica subsp. enterica serovar Typhimurium]